jgi:hypothetical protein
LCQKLGEEAIETVLAAVSEDRERLTAEAADLITTWWSCCTRGSRSRMSRPCWRSAQQSGLAERRAFQK